jgi:hypothetical protein
MMARIIAVRYPSRHYPPAIPPATIPPAELSLNRELVIDPTSLRPLDDLDYGIGPAVDPPSVQIWLRPPRSLRSKT